MLMTPTLPGPARITPHGERLLEAIRSAYPVWINRSGIAEKLNKKRLTQWEIGLLTLLVNSGQLDAQKHPITGVSGYEWEYRAKSD